METFLNALYGIVIDAEFHLGRLRDSPSRKLLRAFDRKGVSGKLNELHGRYDFDTGLGHYFGSLTRARNCLAHRQGVVGDEDCDSEGALILTWLGVDAKITEADGTEHFISPETLGPFDSSEFNQDANARLTVIMTDREQRFERGERVMVPARSLQEICAIASFTCLKLRQLTLN